MSQKPAFTVALSHATSAPVKSAQVLSGWLMRMHAWRQLPTPQPETGSEVLPSCPLQQVSASLHAVRHCSKIDGVSDADEVPMTSTSRRNQEAVRRDEPPRRVGDLTHALWSCRTRPIEPTAEEGRR